MRACRYGYVNLEPQNIGQRVVGLCRLLHSKGPRNPTRYTHGWMESTFGKVVLGITLTCREMKLGSRVHHLLPLCFRCLRLWRFTDPRNREFYIYGSVHRNSILIRSNKMQQYVSIYLLQNHSTCCWCPSHPSSGVHKTVTAASGTGHSICVTTFLQRGR